MGTPALIGIPRVLFAEGRGYWKVGVKSIEKACGLARGKAHHEWVARAEGYLCLRDGWGGAEIRHTPALGDGADGEDAFHPGEGFADTLAAAAAEGEVGEFVARGFGFWGEAVGVEA